MNIFALDKDPVKAARYHCNSHVSKMPVESAQMMAAAIRHADPKAGVRFPSLYKMSHVNHPCSVWVRSSLSNYLWLKELAIELIHEHHFRFGLFREDTLRKITSWPTPDLPDVGLQPFSLAVPEWLKDANLPPVTTYRVLYCSEKLRLLKYKRRLPPNWIPTSVLSTSDRLRRSFPPLIGPSCHTKSTTAQKTPL